MWLLRAELSRPAGYGQAFVSSGVARKSPRKPSDSGHNLQLQAGGIACSVASLATARVTGKQIYAKVEALR